MTMTCCECRVAAFALLACTIVGYAVGVRTDAQAMVSNENEKKIIFKKKKSTCNFGKNNPVFIINAACSRHTVYININIFIFLNALFVLNFIEKKKRFSFSSSNNFVISRLSIFNQIARCNCVCVWGFNRHSGVGTITRTIFLIISRNRKQSEKTKSVSANIADVFCRCICHSSVI